MIEMPPNVRGYVTVQYAWMIVSNTLGHEQLTEHGVNMVLVWELIQDFSGGFWSVCMAMTDEGFVNVGGTIWMET